MASSDKYQQSQYWNKCPTIQDYIDMVKLLTERGEIPHDLFPDYNKHITNDNNRDNKEDI